MSYFALAMSMWSVLACIWCWYRQEKKIRYLVNMNEYLIEMNQLVVSFPKIDANYNEKLCFARRLAAHHHRAGLLVFTDLTPQEAELRNVSLRQAMISFGLAAADIHKIVAESYVRCGDCEHFGACSASNNANSNSILSNCGDRGKSIYKKEK